MQNDVIYILKDFYNHYEAYDMCYSTFKNTVTVTKIITENANFKKWNAQLYYGYEKCA